MQALLEGSPPADGSTSRNRPAFVPTLETLSYSHPDEHICDSRIAQRSRFHSFSRKGRIAVLSEGKIQDVCRGDTSPRYLAEH